MEKKVQNWFCVKHPTREIVGYCYVENDYFCNRCANDHKGHNKVVLLDLKETLERDQDMHRKCVADVHKIYNEQLAHIAVLRGETRGSIDNQIRSISELLRGIEESLQAYLKKVDQEFQEALDRVKKFPQDCDNFLNMITKIIKTEDIATSDVTQEDFRRFCLTFKSLLDGLQVITDNLVQEKEMIFEGFTNFTADAEQTLAPLNNIQDMITLASFRTDNKRVQDFAETEYARIDAGNTNALKQDAMIELIKAVLVRASIKARPTEDQVRDTFAQVDVLKTGVLPKSNIHEFAKAVLQSIK